MFKDFGKRLARDIKRHTDLRIARSEQISGGQHKATPMEVNVISHKRQRYAVWFGGSLLASTVRLSLRYYENGESNQCRPNSTSTVTPRPTTRNMGPVFADITASLPAWENEIVDLFACCISLCLFGCGHKWIMANESWRRAYVHCRRVRPRYYLPGEYRRKIPTPNSQDNHQRDF